MAVILKEDPELQTGGEAAVLPTAPADDRAETDRHFRRLYTEPDCRRSVVDMGPLLDVARVFNDPDFITRAINRVYLGHLLEIPAGDMDDFIYKIARETYAEQFFGQRNISEAQFFDRTTESFRKQVEPTPKTPEPLRRFDELIRPAKERKREPTTILLRSPENEASLLRAMAAGDETDSQELTLRSVGPFPLERNSFSFMDQTPPAMSLSSNPGAEEWENAQPSQVKGFEGVPMDGRLQRKLVASRSELLIDDAKDVIRNAMKNDDPAHHQKLVYQNTEVGEMLRAESEYLNDWALAQNLNPDLIRAIILQESRGTGKLLRPLEDQVSWAFSKRNGSLGYAQLGPKAREAAGLTIKESKTIRGSVKGASTWLAHSVSELRKAGIDSPTVAQIASHYNAEANKGEVSNYGRQVEWIVEEIRLGKMKF